MPSLTRVFQAIPSWLNWPITFNWPDLQHHRLATIIHLTLKMTSAQVVETSVTNDSSFKNYPHPHDHTTRTTDTPGFKPFTKKAGNHTNHKNRYAMRTCVCYLEIQRSCVKEGNTSFANEGHLHFVSVAFRFHCGCWKARYVSELFSFS